MGGNERVGEAAPWWSWRWRARRAGRLLGVVLIASGAVTVLTTGAASGAPNAREHIHLRKLCPRTVSDPSFLVTNVTDSPGKNTDHKTPGPETITVYITSGGEDPPAFGGTNPVLATVTLEPGEWQVVPTVGPWVGEHHAHFEALYRGKRRHLRTRAIGHGKCFPAPTTTTTVPETTTSTSTTSTTVPETTTSTSTTSTTVPETTTSTSTTSTTVPETTSTTVPETTTSTTVSPTTVVAQETTTTTARPDGTVVTQGPTTPSDATDPRPGPRAELPRTGGGSGLTPVGVLAIALGLALLGATRRRLVVWGTS